MKSLNNFWKAVEHYGQSSGIHKSFTTFQTISWLSKPPELHCSLSALCSLPFKSIPVNLLENRDSVVCNKESPMQYNLRLSNLPQGILLSFINCQYLCQKFWNELEITEKKTQEKFKGVCLFFIKSSIPFLIREDNKIRVQSGQCINTSFYHFAFNKHISAATC